MSKKARLNWFIDAVLLVSGLISALSGLYFLLIPSGGYQGGRNPMYGVTVLFDRHTWHDLHLVAGLVMIAAALIHFILHWGWAKAMSRYVPRALLGKGAAISARNWLIITLVVIIGLSFLLVAISSFQLLPDALSGHEASGSLARLPGFGDNRRNIESVHMLTVLQDWETIHTWASVVMLVASALHFAIHWSWVKRTTSRLWGSHGRVPRLLSQGSMPE
jgi:hypothetical protein